MSVLWMILSVLLWLSVLAQLIAIVGLARLLGSILRRINADRLASIDASQPKVADVLDPLLLTDVEGNAIRIPDNDRFTLLIFVSSSCPVCQTLLPHLALLHKYQDHVRIVLGTADASELHAQQFVRNLLTQRQTVVASTQLVHSFGLSAMPFAFLIAPDGRIEAKGLSTTMKDLLSFIEVGTSAGLVEVGT